LEQVVLEGLAQLKELQGVIPHFQPLLLLVAVVGGVGRHLEEMVLAEVLEGAVEVQTV